MDSNPKHCPLSSADSLGKQPSSTCSEENKDSSVRPTSTADDRPQPPEVNSGRVSASTSCGLEQIAAGKSEASVAVLSDADDCILSSAETMEARSVASASVITSDYPSPSLDHAVCSPIASSIETYPACCLSSADDSFLQSDSTCSDDVLFQKDAAQTCAKSQSNKRYTLWLLSIYN